MSNPESYARVAKADILALGANADEVIKNVRSMLIYKNVIHFYSKYPNYVALREKKNKSLWCRIFGAKKPLAIIPWMQSLEDSTEGMFVISQFYNMSFNCDRSDFIKKLFMSAELTTDYVLLCASDVARMTFVKNMINGRYDEQMTNELKKESPSFLADMLEFMNKNISWITWS